MGDKKGKVLVIDDDKDILLTSRIVLKQDFEFIRTESDPFKLQQILREEKFDVILLDMNFSTGTTTGKEGIHWLKEILKFDADLNVIMITAYADINIAIEAMKNGALDFIVKPWDNDKLTATVSSAIKLSQSKKEIQQLKHKQDNLKKEIDKSFTEMIGESDAIKKVLSDIQKVKDTDANVLILGENGTGKELIARAIHRHSNRSEQIFVNVDLGSITESLFESELFGHTKGAFTDASSERIGRFEISNGGSIFLDEIGNLSLAMQSKLLAVLENREVIKVGDHKAIPIDIRLITATNMPINEMINNGSFREDLLYRINTVEIHLPPLRNRSEDIPLLVDFFIKRYRLKYQKNNLKLSSEALKKLKAYQWPGNIRELKHLIERAVIMCESSILNANDFPLRIETTSRHAFSSLNIEEIEKHAIQKAIQKNQGVLSNAAKELGMGRTTLYRKMNKYGL